jgi:hypothetical protein
MRNTNLKIIFILFLINNFIFSSLLSQINVSIVVKVGKSLVTSLDVENEIITNLVINGQEITQESVNKNKNYAIKNLIKKSIKLNEINKYKIKNYNKKDLQNYIKNIAENLNTDLNGLKDIFKVHNISYDLLEEKYIIELKWNTLIFQIYKNQTNINIVEVENNVEKIKENKSEEELKIIKKNVLEKKTKEKLNLFSRSHFSNLENTVIVDFK